MFLSQSRYRFRRRSPQSKASATKPNQTVHLSVLVKQLMQGQALNVGLALEGVSDATFDTPDLSKLDFRHMTINEVEGLKSKVTPPSVSSGAPNGAAPKENPPQNSEE